MRPPVLQLFLEATTAPLELPPPVGTGPLHPVSTSASYRELVSDVANEQPFRGYNDVSDLPDFITDGDIALVIHSNPEAFKSVALDMNAIGEIYAMPDTSLAGLYSRLGLYLAELLTPVAKRQLLADVQQECDNLAESAHERSLERFYGGSGPQTERERQELMLRRSEFR